MSGRYFNVRLNRWFTEEQDFDRMLADCFAIAELARKERLLSTIARNAAAQRQQTELNKHHYYQYVPRAKRMKSGK